MPRQPNPKPGLDPTRRLRRLDSGSDVVFLRVLTLALVAFLWILPWLPSRNHGHPPPSGFYPGVAAFSLVLLLWLRRMRQVSFDGECFVLKDWFSQPVAVPKSHLVKVRAIPLGRGMAWFTFVFDPRTKYGATVRVMTGMSGDTDRFRRIADEMKAIAEKRPPKIPTLVSKDTMIEVHGWTRAELAKIASDFTALYEISDRSIVLGDPENGVIRLCFPGGFDAEQFIFLVNYLHYPEHFDLAHRSISARGSCTLTPAFHLPDPELAGQRATFFVPPDDTEYDFVLATLASGETYRIPFTDLHWKPLPQAH